MNDARKTKLWTATHGDLVDISKKLPGDTYLGDSRQEPPALIDPGGLKLLMLGLSEVCLS